MAYGQFHRANGCGRRALCALVAAGLFAVAQARDDQVWLSVEAEAGVWGGLRVKGEQYLKYDNSRLAAEESLVMLGWAFNPHVSVWAGHRILRERAGGRGHLQTEHRPTFDFCLAVPEFWTLKFDFRSRVEWRDKKGAQPCIRYRERFRLRTSWSFSDFRISPFVSTELFFSDKPKQDDADLFDRNRSQIGLTFRPLPSVENLSCCLYFMVQHDMSDNSSTWDPTNVYGATLSYKF